MKILIVDDIAENLDLLEDIFTTYNYSTIRAKNGLEALEVLKDENVLLIVSDILMPKMDGFQLCSEVRNTSAIKNIPFIFYTAHYYDPEDKEYALRIGADRYFVKPVDISVLMESVNELIAKTTIKEIKPEDDDNVHKSDHNFSLQDYKELKDKMFELGMANEHLMKKNKELIVSHGRYRGLFENAGDAIFLIEPKSGTILDANQQAEKSTGFKRDELLGMRLFNLQSILENSSKEGKGKIFETVIQDKNGENAIFEITSNFITESETEIIQAIARNVTEQRKLKEKLIQTDKLISLGHLSAGIAHEIRNPLASININLQLLLRTLPQQTQEYEILKSAMLGVERIRKIIDSTLDYVRINKTGDQKEDINQIILSTMPLIQVSMVKKDIEIKLDLAETLPHIKADAKQIQQVLINLLTNASEAIHSKGEIIIKTFLEDQYLILSITDTGEGINPENLSHIFEPFYTGKSGGTGLGLSVVKDILQNHRSSIQVNSELANGTTFIIKFPIIGNLYGETKA